MARRGTFVPVIIQPEGPCCSTGHNRSRYWRPDSAFSRQGAVELRLSSVVCLPSVSVVLQRRAKANECMSLLACHKGASLAPVGGHTLPHSGDTNSGRPCSIFTRRSAFKTFGPESRRLHCISKKSVSFRFRVGRRFGKSEKLQAAEAWECHGEMRLVAPCRRDLFWSKSASGDPISQRSPP